VEKYDTARQATEDNIILSMHVACLKGKYCEEYMAQHMRGDAGVRDGIMNSTAYTRSQILWRTSKLED